MGLSIIAEKASHYLSYQDISALSLVNSETRQGTAPLLRLLQQAQQCEENQTRDINVRVFCLAVRHGIIVCDRKEWCSWAALRGLLTILQWLRANGCPWDVWTCAQAAEEGNLPLLQWARENGCPWDGRTCASAALNGHLTVLQWARANGCPWDARTCAHAALNGHLTVLHWAWESGCPWDAWSMNYQLLAG